MNELGIPVKFKHHLVSLQVGDDVDVCMSVWIERESRTQVGDRPVNEQNMSGMIKQTRDIGTHLTPSLHRSDSQPNTSSLVWTMRAWQGNHTRRMSACTRRLDASGSLPHTRIIRDEEALTL